MTQDTASRWPPLPTSLKSRTLGLLLLLAPSLPLWVFLAEPCNMWQHVATVLPARQGPSFPCLGQRNTALQGCCENTLMGFLKEQGQAQWRLSSSSTHRTPAHTFQPCLPLPGRQPAPQGPRSLLHTSLQHLGPPPVVLDLLSQSVAPARNLEQ